MSEMTATRMGSRRAEATRAIALGAAVALWLVAASLLWRTAVPDGLSLPALEPDRLFSAGQLRESAGYARVARGLWLASQLLQLGVLCALAALGPQLAARVRGGPIRRGLVVLALVLVALWLARLPFGAAAHWWRRGHGLSRQGYVDWLLAPWLELAASALVAALALVGAMLLARRLGGRWWLAGGPLLAVVGAGIVLLQPLVLAPRLDPLEDRRLVAEIRQLGRLEGVRPLPVEVKRASERTTRPNAEVAGIGPTRRVVLWDTLLDGRFSRGEILFVAAHELAHVGRRHLWKGVAWLALLAVPCVWVLARATRPLGGLAEPGAVPLAALVVVAIQLALLPFVNAVSRRYEAEADWVALEATRDPAAARGVFRLFSEESLAQPDPPAWSRPLLGSHPTLVERIAMADAWARRR
jgi:Zn-dependent protease with chaperone function